MNKKKVILIVLVFLVILLITAVSFYYYSNITGKVIVSCGNSLCESNENPLVCPDDCLINKYLVYADSYRTIKSGTAKEYLSIGHYDFFDNNQVKINYFFYDAAKNNPGGTTNKTHNKLNAPYGGHCRPGYVHIPSYEQYNQFNGTWTIGGDLLKIQIGGVIHEWGLNDSKNKFFRLNRPYYNSSTDLPIINGATFTNTIGFGYISDNVLLKDVINRNNLLDNYGGDLYQNNKLSTSNWAYYSSGLSVYVFNAENDPNVLGYSYPCGYSGHPNMWCLSTLLLNYASYSKLLIYHNGGHDYNENGCYNELGHRKQMFGIMENSKITKMVFIEYSYEDDGYPIISVGRYFKQDCRIDIDCNDNNPCTDDICTAQSTCQNINNDSNTCNDGLWCTINDRCISGNCVADQRIVNDNILCTIDSCNEDNDQILHIPDNNLCDNDIYCNGHEDCNDNLACTIDSCIQGNCQYDDSNCECNSNADCNDNNPCTTDTCVNGRCENRNNNLDCNDNNQCTIQDKCFSGACSGNLKNCNDNKRCTVDSCNVLNGNCFNIFDSSINNCECDSDLNCNDNIACTTDLCKNNKCEHNLNNSACDNNIYCNGQETCSLTRGCVSGTSVNCDDNNAGTYDVCNETLRRCEHSAISIDSDRDGVPDERDKCNNTPLSLRERVNKHGCAKPLADKFDIKSDFENRDILNLSNLEIGISGKGKIVFSETVCLSRRIGNNEEQIDLDSYINISQNKIEINSSALPELNKSAKITMYNISLVNPRILKDNHLCSECIILNWSSNARLLEFNVSHFSVYALEETPYCGDGYCNGGEICSSCSVDCGKCPTGDDGGSARCSILNWTCSDWSSCSVGNKTRVCISNCNTKKTDKESCLVSSFTENITIQEEVSKIQEDKLDKKFIFIILLICLIVIVLVWLLVYLYIKSKMAREQSLEKIIEPGEFV